MSLWHAPHNAHPRPPGHPLSLQEIVIFAGGVLVAMMVGIAAGGVLPT